MQNVILHYQNKHNSEFDKLIIEADQNVLNFVLNNEVYRCLKYFWIAKSHWRKVIDDGQRLMQSKNLLWYRPYRMSKFQPFFCVKNNIYSDIEPLKHYRNTRQKFIIYAVNEVLFLRIKQYNYKNKPFHLK